MGGLGPCVSIVGWLGWVKKNGPTSISAATVVCFRDVGSAVTAGSR